MIGFSCSDTSQSRIDELNCKCDSTSVLKIINSNDYLKIDKYDSPSFSPDSIYSLSAKQNRLLWFRDIESIDTTKFTKYWNDYRPDNYHADNSDFISYYSQDKDIELAFQFGPGGMMWTYHSFVIKKIDCCYLITRSSFTHARFRYKAYAFLSETQLNDFRKILEPFSTDPAPLKEEEYGYHGHFIDSKRDKPYIIDFDNEIDENSNEPTQAVMSVYKFVDDSIKWIDTYGT